MLNKVSATDIAWFAMGVAVALVVAFYAWSDTAVSTVELALMAALAALLLAGGVGTVRANIPYYRDIVRLFVGVGGAYLLISSGVSLLSLLFLAIGLGGAGRIIYRRFVTRDGGSGAVRIL